MFRRHRRLLVAILAVAVAAPVLGEEPKLGEKAGDVHAEKWHNLKAGVTLGSSVSLRRLRGKIVLIEFFECGDSASLKVVPELLKLYEDVKENGVVMVGLTRDPPEKVTKYLTKYKKPYPIGSGSRTLDKYTPKMPWFMVVDPDNKIAGFHHEFAEIKKALDATLQKSPPKPDSEMAVIFEEEAAEKLKEADKLYKAKRLPDAWDAYCAIAEDYPTVASGKKAKSLAAKTKIELDEGTASLSLKRADEAMNKKKYTAAMKEYTRIVDKWPDTPSGKKAQAHLDKMQKDPALSKDVRETEAAKKCKGWLQTARGLAKNDRIDEARRYYKMIIDNYPNTSFAETAKVEMDKLKA